MVTHSPVELWISLTGISLRLVEAMDGVNPVMLSGSLLTKAPGITPELTHKGGQHLYYTWVFIKHHKADKPLIHSLFDSCVSLCTSKDEPAVKFYMYFKEIFLPIFDQSTLITSLRFEKATLYNYIQRTNLPALVLLSTKYKGDLWQRVDYSLGQLAHLRLDTDMLGTRGEHWLEGTLEERKLINKFPVHAVKWIELLSF